ncbi:hypothetical protein D3C73_1527710 [compost metagenome]
MAATLIAIARHVLLLQLAVTQRHLALLAADLAAGQMGVALHVQRHVIFPADGGLHANRIVIDHVGVDLELAL